jgi:hypothetical protein
MQHNEFRVDGVLVHHFPSDEELTSISLVFAAGVRDELLPTFGSLHALEHLCLGAVRNTPLEINGVVDRLTTQFTAQGRTSLVGPWLERLCMALGSPPVEQLEAEAQVLVAEGEGVGSPADVVNLVRFGNRDLGLGLAPAPAPRSLPVQQLLVDARRWFAAANALLVVEGPLPELRLPLPEGQRFVHHWPAAVRLARPEAVLLDADCVAVSLILPPPDPARLDLLTGRLLENRLAETIRHQRGLAYHVASEGWPLPSRGTALTVWAEPRPGKTTAASEAMVDCISDVLTHGPSGEELDTAREQVRTGASGRDGLINVTVNAALGTLLFGSPDTPLDLQLIDGVTVDLVTSYLQALGTDVLYLLGADAEPAARRADLPVRELEPLQTALPADGTVYRPPLAARLISHEARTIKLVTTDEALWHQIGPDITRIRWADAAGLLNNRDDDTTILYSLDGTAIPVDERLSGSKQALAEIRRQVPPALWYVNEPEHEVALTAKSRISRT